MKIIVDILGGDNAPTAIIDGVVRAATEDQSIEFVLVGDEAQIKPNIEKNNLLNRVEIIHTTENISCDEQPTTAIKGKPESSIVKGLEALKNREDCGAFVSAGSTGAVLTGAFLKVGRIKGVSRPALSPLFPTKTGGQVVILDIGANVDCKPSNLVHFALMGNEYMKARGIENPRVALVNVGVEEAKGNELTHATFPILKKLSDEGTINFVGNMEARDAMSGDYDVLVCDGFVGNILLKSSEGAMKFLMSKIKEALTSSFKTKMGAMLVKKRLKAMVAEIGEEAAGGSIFLGIKKPVIKAHGNSSAAAFANAIHLAKRSTKTNLADQITTALEKVTLEE